MSISTTEKRGLDKRGQRSPFSSQSTIALIFPKVRSPLFYPSTIALIFPKVRSPLFSYQPIVLCVRAYQSKTTKYLFQFLHPTPDKSIQPLHTNTYQPS
ncbi:hypothetical protein QUA27_09815 [Microcoleus sp. Pol14C6]|uniref:hypothetical protein n=1 Tax=unclassified Microcoleus TaxID=2642155 RepID=UPI002FD60C25